MCHHYEREQLTTTAPISDEHADEAPDIERSLAEAPPAADD
ncbi:hypothetical protein GCM10028857_25590 [Salinarchaeum chitinilyticum]